MKLRYFTFLFSMVLFSCSAPTTRTHVIETHDNGNPRLERTFEISEQDSSAVYEKLFYESGAVKMEGSLDENGERHGEWKAYFNDGSTWSLGSFKHGKRHGESIVFHPNGQKYSTGEYEDGKQTGVWKFWNKEGKSLDEKNFGSK